MAREPADDHLLGCFALLLVATGTVLVLGSLVYFGVEAASDGAVCDGEDILCGFGDALVMVVTRDVTRLAAALLGSLALLTLLAEGVRRLRGYCSS